MNKKYEIKNKISLTFVTSREKFDVMFTPDDKVCLEVGVGKLGATIWAVSETTGERMESITMSNFIDFALDRGDIEEIL